MNWDIALPMVSLLLTVLLAYIGIEMANRPPTSSIAKWIYRSIFTLIGALLLVVNYRQAVRSINEQARIRTDANTEQRKIEAQYNQVQGTLNNITRFVSQPHPNLDPQQITAIVRAMAGTAEPQKDRLDALLALEMPGIISKLQQQADALRGYYADWEANDDNEVSRARIRKEDMPTPEMNRLLSKFREQVTGSLPDVDDTRAQALKLLGTNTKKDKDESAIIAAIIRDKCVNHRPEEIRDISNYLSDDLSVRLRAAISKP